MAIKREKVIRTAEKLVGKGKLEAAIKEYRKVLAENPNDANTLNRVGDLYARIERFDEAVKLFSQIADQYTRDGFFVKAIAIYKKIIKLSPQSLQVYERLAELYHKQGLLNEARTQYQILGDHYEKRDNATSAITIYQRMTEIDPDNPSHYLKLAQLYQGQQLTDKAIRAYRQLADLFVVNGSIDEATQVYLSALDTYSNELDFVREVVQGLHDEGYSEAAQKVLAKATSLHPAAEAIGREVFGAPEPEPAASAADPGVADAEGGEDGMADAVAQGEAEEISFEVDDSVLAMPEDPQPVEAAQPAASPSSVGLSPFGQEEEDDSVFTLDLDSDDPPATQVMPPPDMVGDVESAAAEFDLEIEDDPEAAFGEVSVDTGEPHDELDGQEAPEELDFSSDFGGEVVDAVMEPGEEGESDVAEIELDEFEIELEEDEDEDVAPEGESAPVGTPQTRARHEDDLLAEAKVFSKYGLREKAEDRLKELLAIQPEHLGGLNLLARIELDSGRKDEALERAREVARIAREEDAPELWNELHEELAKAGYVLEEDQIIPEPEAKPAENDRFAQLLEDLDETATGLTVVPEAEGTPSVALEPEPTVADGAATEPVVAESGPVDLEITGLPGELEEDLVTLDLEPDVEPPAIEEDDDASPPITRALDPAALAAALPEPDAVAEVGKATVAFDQSFFDVEEEIFDEEPVEAAVPPPPIDVEAAVPAVPEPPAPPAPEPAAPAPPVGSGEEPFAEIEALMQSVTRATGFEELVPEETSLEELMPFEDAAGDDTQLPPVAEKGPSTATAKVSLVDELGLEEMDEFSDLEDAVSPEPSEAPDVAEDVRATRGMDAGAQEAGPSAVDLDETGMSWLDDVVEPSAESGGEDESIFDEEDDFFDLAAELEAEMSDGADKDLELETAQEQSLEEIIDGFKRGVAENLSAEDFDTHYNLGIAYREMGLLDEAIGEFQLASKDPRYIVDCSSMLGMCFLEKGLPELAVRWYKKGLESPAAAEEQALGLLYDLGSVYLSMGDTESAYRTFVEIYGMNSNYRDVAQRIQELQEPAASS